MDLAKWCMTTFARNAQIQESATHLMQYVPLTLVCAPLSKLIAFACLMLVQDSVHFDRQERGRREASGRAGSAAELQ
jgi:hypothetical protein